MTAHAVLGPGGIGGLIGGALAHAGSDVAVVPRGGQVSEYPTSITVNSSTLGRFTAPVSVWSRVDTPVEVLWITVKSQQLEEALEAVDSRAVADALVVPLLNGLDHVALLRRRFPSAVVAPGAIRTESTRIAPGQITHGGWHVVKASTGGNGDLPRPVKPVQLSGPSAARERVDDLAQQLEAAGIPCQVWDDENYVLWNKLAILCPYALATTAVAGSIGAVRSDPEIYRLLLECVDEVLDVAASEGVELDRDEAHAMIGRFPDEMRVSMERDASAGVPIEIDAITAPVLRLGEEHQISVAATERLRLLAADSAARLRESLSGTPTR